LIVAQIMVGLIRLLLGEEALVGVAAGGASFDEVASVIARQGRVEIFRARRLHLLHHGVVSRLVDGLKRQSGEGLQVVEAGQQGGGDVAFIVWMAS
jgi:hypothetical protein